jgi:hypothetical protein
VFLLLLLLLPSAESIPAWKNAMQRAAFPLSPPCLCIQSAELFLISAPRRLQINQIIGHEWISAFPPELRHKSARRAQN